MCVRKRMKHNNNNSYKYLHKITHKNNIEIKILYEYLKKKIHPSIALLRERRKYELNIFHFKNYVNRNI